MDLYNVIKRPYISEKGHALTEDQNVVTFIVDMAATKDDVRDALKKIWNITPVSIRTMITTPKTKRYGKTYGQSPSVKKAFVRLPEGQAIEVLK